jgi:L-threonylcarbamoyladenylate synthase
LVKRAAAILRQGGVGAFPTETVYGLGARVFDGEAVARIFSIKGRPFDNPLIVHIAEQKQLRLLSPEILAGVGPPAVADDLIKAFWPGPLTLVLKRLDAVPAIVSAGLSTIAVRMPNHPMALELIRELGEPIAAPSANRSGRTSPTSARAVREALEGSVDFILDGGPCEVGLESTVLDMTSSPPRVLRPGAISLESLRSVIGAVTAYSEAYRAVSSPGQTQGHYAPALKMVIVDPDQWQTILEEAPHFGKRLGTISLQKGQNASLSYCRVMADLSDYARNLFAAFFDAEAAGVEVLFAERVAKDGLGAAIMDRLERADASAVIKNDI